MQVIDLSHPLAPDIPVYPNDPPVRQNPLARFETDGWRLTEWTVSSHVGTHIDAPAHLWKDGRTLDTFPVDAFIGRGVVLDCTGCGQVLVPELLEGCLAACTADFLLFYTGQAALWHSPDYGADAPCIGATLAAQLAALPCRGIGLDTLSPDPVGSDELPAHRTLLGADKLIMENLCNLEQLLEKRFTLYALPMPLCNADGAPARIVAVCE